VTELARGTVGDRSWGLTLGALGLRGLSGQLVLSDPLGKRYQVAFSAGAVVGATSPLASDAVVRIAMTGGLVSSTQVSDIARRTAANPQRDEVEVIAEAVRLAPEQALRLRRRAVAQRAARTFSVERGDFIVDDRVSIPVVAGTELDIRAVIFLGARSAMADTRLANELAQFGGWFHLKPEAFVDLPQFGFAREEDPVLDLLEAGAAMSDLEKMGSDAHVVRAMVYALMSCSALDSDAPPRPSRAMSRDLQRAATPVPVPNHPSQPMRSPVATPVATTQPMPARLAPDEPTMRRVSEEPTVRRPGRAPAPPAADDLGDGATLRRPSTADARTMAQQAVPRTAGSATVNPQQAAEVRVLIKKHLELLKKRVDHFTLLGTHIDATPDEIRKAYFGLARQLHPDRLSALDIPDENKEAQRLFAQVNTAFAVVSDPARRQEYVAIQRRGGEAAVAAEQARAEAMALRIIEGEEAFRRGEAALRRDQLSTALAEFARAIELNPDEVDYVALQTWAQFCASPDKMAMANNTRTTLDRAIQKSPRAVTPRFYLGRVERMLGRDADALRHFQEVLRLEPHNTEAASEARVIEQRLAGATRKR
jgi:DnaJ domain